MDDISKSQLGLGALGAAGAITGGILGATGFGALGMGIAASATAATGLGAQIANMFRKPPEVPGPTPGQMIAAERTETIAGRSMEAAGLSPAELNALEISQFGNRMRMQQVLNAFNQIYTMSPVEREVLSKNLINKEMEQRREQEAALVTMNREAVERNMTRALKASESQAAQEAEIRKAEWNKRVQELSFEQGRWQNFGAAVGEVGDAAAGYLEYLDMQKEKALQERETASARINKAVESSMALNADASQADIPMTSKTLTMADRIAKNYLDKKTEAANAQTLRELREKQAKDKFDNLVEIKEAGLYNQAPGWGTGLGYGVTSTEGIG